LSRGQFEVNLGGCLYKKRVALGSKGKSGGARTIIVFRHDDKAFFIYGFSKNRKENITLDEEAALKKIGKVYLSYDERQIQKALEIKEFMMV
jgi:hypothetical protein